jgi:glutathione synthase/RimK-type ligase-like ATP-grasp enzyme
MARIAILRCGQLPSFVTWDVPNFDELFTEDKLLQRGFEAQGFDADIVVWSQPDINWNYYDIALIRSTWDYLDQKDLFLEVLAQIEASTCILLNPLEAVRWNIDKHYLFDLERWGVPIIPTYLASHVETDTFHRIFTDKGWRTAIIKPMVGLAASYTHKVPLDELEDTLRTLKANHSQQEFMIQPFIESVVNEGEWSFIYFDRNLSHALLKKPAPNDYRVQGIYGGTIQRAEPHPDDLAQAQAILNKLPFDILQARLDFIRVDGYLSIIEVELIEPIFSFNLVPESIERLVDAVRIKFESDANRGVQSRID